MAGSPIKRERRERWKAFTQNAEAIEDLWDTLAEGISLLVWTKLNDFPYCTVHQWITDDPARTDRYARAKQSCAQKLAEEALEIADDSRNDTQVDGDGKVIVNYDQIQRAKLRAEQRRWHAGKLAPSVWGERIQQDIKATVSIEDELLRLPKSSAAVTPSA